MFRKKDGKNGFSFMRLINNSFPNFAFDDKYDVDLSPTQQDNLFKWQISQTDDPRPLNERSFFVGGIVDNESYSRKIFVALKKSAVIDPKTLTLHTSRISKHFANQLAIISVHAQRKLVGLLFFWEEELVRWRLLDEEEAEIKKAMDIHGKDGGELMVALRVVETKRGMLPSLRGAVLEEASLPRYGERRGTVSIHKGE